jgi:hypothetical protein
MITERFALWVRKGLLVKRDIFLRTVSLNVTTALYRAARLFRHI